MMASSRPRSVSILVLLQSLQSVILFGAGVLFLVFQGEPPPGFSLTAQLIPLAVLDSLASAWAMFLLGGLGLVIAFALSRLKKWAWMAAVLLQGLGLTAGIINYLRDHPNYVGMLSGIILVLWLNQQEVRSVFEGKRESGS
jgi:hypothetical protein